MHIVRDTRAVRDTLAVRDALATRLAQRVVVLDGAMATTIQRQRLGEAEVRGDRFTRHPGELRGNYDLLVLTRPQVIAGIHDAYLAAGADIIRTNTFSSTSVAQASYGLEAIAYELNREAARLAREAAVRWTRQTPERLRFVAGVIGPTDRIVEPDAGGPAGASRSPAAARGRGISAGQLRTAYREQVRGLLDGGAHLLLLETVWDTSTATAALAAIDDELEARRVDVPLMISVTLNVRTGRLLSGESVESVCRAVAHAQPFSLGVNCGAGVHGLRPYLAAFGRLAPTYVSCHPSAGLPDASGHYAEQAEETAAVLRAMAASGEVNIVGGCCGTTPAHVAAMVRAVEGLPPRLLRPGPHC